MLLVGLILVLEEILSILLSGVSSVWCCWKLMILVSSVRFWLGLCNW